MRIVGWTVLVLFVLVVLGILGYIGVRWLFHHYTPF